MASTSPLDVLTDSFLLKYITSFAAGIPWPLYAFWLKHKDDGTRVMDDFHVGDPVVRKVVEHGMVDMLELAKHARFQSASSKFFPSTPLTRLNLDVVVRFAIQCNRPEALDWGLAYQLEPTNPCSWDRVPHKKLWDLVFEECGKRDDTRMLDVLKRHVPLDGRTLARFSRPDFVACKVNTVAQLRWLVKTLPDLELDQTMLTAVARKGNLEIVKYLFERGGCGRCSADTLAVLHLCRHWEVMAFLLDHDLIDVHANYARGIIASQDEFIQKLVHKHAPRFQEAFEAFVRSHVDVGDTVRVSSLLDDKRFDTGFRVPIDSAARNGHLGVIELLYTRGNASTAAKAMDIATENKHWDVVKFLRTNCSEDCC